MSQGTSTANRDATGQRTELAAAFIFYSITFAWFGRAWLQRMSDSVAVDSSLGAKAADAQLIVWILSWVSRCLRSDFSRILDAPINHPTPNQLTGSEHFASAQLLFFPIDAIVGNPLIAANLTAMLLYPLTALAMFAFMRNIGVRPPVAIFAGFALALGPLHVPGNMQILQTLLLFFPLTAIAIRRLRDVPSVRRALALSFVHLAALLSSYYIAMLSTAFAIIWSIVEGVRPLPGRIRFAIVAVASLSAASAVCVAVSWPYLDQSHLHQSHLRADGMAIWTAERIALARGPMLLKAFGEQEHGLGVVLSVMAVLGLISLSQKDLRGHALGCIALAAIGLFIAVAGIQSLAHADLPRPMGEIFLLGGKLFRLVPRGLLLTGFAFAALAGLGLETLWRRSVRFAAGAFTVSLVLLLATRGSAFGAPHFKPIRAFGEYRSAYRTIGDLIGDTNAGGLLELPRHRGVGNADAEAMMGQIIHRVPLVTGYTGYQPSYRWVVDRHTIPPIEHDDLEKLIEMTDVRWVLVRPKSDWPSVRQHESTTAQIRSSPTFASEHEIDEFILFELTNQGR